MILTDRDDRVRLALLTIAAGLALAIAAIVFQFIAVHALRSGDASAPAATDRVGAAGAVNGGRAHV